MQLTSAALRPAGAADGTLLRDLFQSGRPELAGLPEPLIALQQQAQRHQYDMTFPGHSDLIISVEGRDVGRCWLWRSDAEHRLLDLVVLPGDRGRGVARSVLSTLAETAAEAGLPLRLSVWAANLPAIGLYRSFGFVPYGEQHGYLLLQLLPSTAG
jgi:GNAT superfamily N-acetyltransferase